MKLETLKNLRLPDKPGVYFFLGPPKRSEGGLKSGKILYIGKATSLRDRTKSYFSNDLISARGPLILDMVFKADTVKWEATDSVLEAIILEANLIKKHQPYYNTKEKDDKSFNYVCITKDSLPQVLVVRGRNLKNLAIQKFSRSSEGGQPDTQKSLYSKVFGPFTSGTQLREAMKIIRRIFPYIDATSNKKMSYEFYHQLGLTPEVGNKELEIAYKNNIANFKLFFEGKKKRVISNFKKEMNEFAKKREFEKANEIKKRIFALMHINDVALLKNENIERVMGNTFRIESYDIAHMGGKNMVGVMTVVENGQVDKNEYRKFKIRTQSGSNDTGALTEVLERRLVHTEWKYPNLIVVDGGVAQLNALLKVSKRVGISIPIVSVVKDERHKPKDILGDKALARKYEREILLANSESHRFAINYHKNMRNKNFLR